jgi:hypothetical protein
VQRLVASLVAQCAARMPPHARTAPRRARRAPFSTLAQRAPREHPNGARGVAADGAVRKDASAKASRRPDLLPP